MKLEEQPHGKLIFRGGYVFPNRSHPPPHPVNEQLANQDLSLPQSCYNPTEVIDILLY